MKKFQFAFYFLIFILHISKAEEEKKEELNDINIMSDKEFIRIMNTKEKVISQSEVGLKMHLMAQKAMKITNIMNNKYLPPSELRRYMSVLIGQELDEGFGLFPPFFTDCGKNIHLGKNIIINSGCNFQDQGGIYIGDNTIIEKNVVMKTINYDLNPKTRGDMWPKPIHIGKMFGLELELLYYLVSILVIILLLLLEVLLLKMFLKIRFMEEILLNL